MFRTYLTAKRNQKRLSTKKVQKTAGFQGFVRFSVLFSIIPAFLAQAWRRLAQHLLLCSAAELAW